LTGHEDHEDLPVAARTRQLEERLIAAGLTTDDEIDEYLTGLYTRATPVNGAQMAARAWAGFSCITAVMMKSFWDKRIA